MNNARFNISHEELSDGSPVYNVVLHEQDGDVQILWEAPSERSPDLAANALNDVMQAFVFAGSDYDALQLASAIARACKTPE
jgi:hypothetical protein